MSFLRILCKRRHISFLGFFLFLIGTPFESFNIVQLYYLSVYFDKQCHSCLININFPYFLSVEFVGFLCQYVTVLFAFFHRILVAAYIFLPLDPFYDDNHILLGLLDCHRYPT